MCFRVEHLNMHGCMNGLDGWTDGWMPGWLDGSMAGWMDGGTDGQIGAWQIDRYSIFSKNKPKPKLETLNPLSETLNPK